MAEVTFEGLGPSNGFGASSSDVLIVPGSVIFPDGGKTTPSVVNPPDNKDVTRKIGRLGAGTIFPNGGVSVPSVVTPPDNMATISNLIPGSVAPPANPQLFSPPVSTNPDTQVGAVSPKPISFAGVINAIPNISPPQNTGVSVSFAKTNPPAPYPGDLTYTIVVNGQTILVDVNGNPIQPYAQVIIGKTINVDNGG